MPSQNRITGNVLAILVVFLGVGVFLYYYFKMDKSPQTANVGSPEQLSELSSRLSKSDEIIRRQTARINALEARLDESDRKSAALSETVDNLTTNSESSPDARGIAEIKNQERTKEFLLDAVDRGFNAAWNSDSLSAEDRICLIQQKEFLRKSILAGKDPRVTKEMLLVAGASKTSQLMIRWFPEFVTD